MTLASLSRVPKGSAFRSKHKALLDRIEQFKRVDKFGTNGLITPPELVDWVNGYGVPIDDKFRDAIALKAHARRGDEDVRVVHTLYRMLLMLVWNNYGYEPWSDSQVSVATIISKLTKAGNLQVDEKTWKKHLKLAVEYATQKEMIKPRKIPMKVPPIVS